MPPMRSIHSALSLSNGIPSVFLAPKACNVHRKALRGRCYAGICTTVFRLYPCKAKCCLLDIPTQLDGSSMYMLSIHCMHVTSAPVNGHPQNPGKIGDLFFELW